MRYIVETDKLRHNVAVLKKEMPDTPLLAVLKCNGYGLGLVETAKLLKAEGIHDFAVLTFAEAAALRAVAPDDFIMMLTPAADEQEAAQAVALKLAACVDCAASAARLEAAAAAANTTTPVQLALDVGFGRYGFVPGEEDAIAQTLTDCPHLQVVGTYAHFHSSFGDGKSVKTQTAAFLAMTEKLSALGVDVGRRHIANSAAALRFADTRLDMVRVGSALCGRLSVFNRWGLKPVGFLEAPVTAVKRLPKGANLGYGDMYHLKKDTTVAVVPVGHDNGFGMTSARDSFRLRDIARYMWNNVKDLWRDHRVFVTVNGKRVPLVGGRGLTNCYVDVSDVPCKVGDTVVFSVSSVGIPADVEREYR